MKCSIGKYIKEKSIFYGNKNPAAQKLSVLRRGIFWWER